MSPSDGEQGISARLADLRRQIFGERGRAAFARALGVSPSTYNYYEKGRPPPADLLARAAEVAGADIGWLLTGRGEAFPAQAETATDTQLSQSARSILERFAPGGAAAPEAAAWASLRALLRQMDSTTAALAETWQPHRFAPTPTSIPILGRTAAGLSAAWDACFAGEEESDVLERLIRRVEGAEARRRPGRLSAADPQGDPAQPGDTTAFVTQLDAPTSDGVVEFLDVPGLGAVEPGTFALRVDGDSMSPRLRDGDLVVSHRRAEPVPGSTAIVRLRDRIGVTVKLWRPEGDRVHLIPINEAYDPHVWMRSEVLWACRVLWLVRV
ncbi:MAG TPA: S24 family peptidase [Phycisphaerae bacterium]|nr:S24 family peptidase [Phycisphaerae bacterium]